MKFLWQRSARPLDAIEKRPLGAPPWTWELVPVDPANANSIQRLEGRKIEMKQRLVISHRLLGRHMSS
jgi:hypothetical protein